MLALIAKGDQPRHHASTGTDPHSGYDPKIRNLVGAMYAPLGVPRTRTEFEAAIKAEPSSAAGHLEHRAAGDR
jgi:hypothetical protein